MDKAIQAAIKERRFFIDFLLILVLKIRSSFIIRRIRTHRLAAECSSGRFRFPSMFHRRVTRSCRIVRDTLDSTAITSDNNGRPDFANVLLSSHKPNGQGDSDNAGIQYGRVQHGVHALVDDEHDRRDLSGKFGYGMLSPNEPPHRFLLLLIHDN